MVSWYAVQTKPRHEKKVDRAFQEKGIESFLPLYKEKRKWSDRYQWVELPLFSHYVFVRIRETPQHRVSVLRTNGVFQFAGRAGLGTPIPDEQMENLLALAQHCIPMAPHQFLKIGQRVRVRGGALHGIEGLLVAIRNDKSLVVSVDLIQRSVVIRVDGFELDGI